MVVLCLSLVLALDAPAIPYPVFSPGCHHLRSTLTDLREQPGSEEFARHLTPRMVRETEGVG